MVKKIERGPGCIHYRYDYGNEMCGMKSTAEKIPGSDYFVRYVKIVKCVLLTGEKSCSSRELYKDCVNLRGEDDTCALNGKTCVHFVDQSKPVGCSSYEYIGDA